MSSLRQSYYSPAFSHIYVEQEVWEHPRTKNILKHFPDAVTIEIVHYKDVFCRKRQDVALQNQVPMLVIAKKREPYLYPGAPVCQDFGQEHFYYTSCAMNCIYDCSYCYLKGMYPSGNLVVFVNLEDIFLELEKRLKEHAMYVCISYDTDLLALETITGFVEEWMVHVQKQDKLTVECRTKCARVDLWKRFSPNPRMVFAFTLSPQKIIETTENKTPSLQQRLAAAQGAMDAGFRVRLCFDPMLYHSGWKKEYQELVEQAAESLDMGRIQDVSVGSFRISQDYLKKMRKAMPMSCVAQFPYENDGGFYQYPKALRDEMEGFMLEMLKEKLPETKIFRWNV